jgi:hypothetical protein
MLAIKYLLARQAFALQCKMDPTQLLKCGKRNMKIKASQNRHYSLLCLGMFKLNLTLKLNKSNLLSIKPLSLRKNLENFT